MVYTMPSRSVTSALLASVHTGGTSVMYIRLICRGKDTLQNKNHRLMGPGDSRRSVTDSTINQHYLNRNQTPFLWSNIMFTTIFLTFNGLCIQRTLEWLHINCWGCSTPYEGPRRLAAFHSNNCHALCKPVEWLSMLFYVNHRLGLRCARSWCIDHHIRLCAYQWFQGCACKVCETHKLKVKWQKRTG